MEHNKKKSIEKKNHEFTGYLPYPKDEDIFIASKEESEIDPEDLTKLKQPNEEPGMRNEKDFTQDFDGEDLDIPGAELDDDLEEIGSEDEENNYYSLGGDNHIDLEESKSEL